MFKQFSIALASLFLCASLAQAASHASAAPAMQTAQQSKMGDCNKSAGDKKGDERKAHMKSCLSAKPVAAAAATTTQQGKMKACNKDAGAKQLKGDERKSFMSSCLKA